MSKFERGGYRHPCVKWPGKWKKFRRAWLDKFPLCAKCGRVANHLDHIIPLKSWKDCGLAQLLDVKNVQSLCAPCHASKTSSENHRHGLKPKKYCECGHPHVDGKPICGNAACMAEVDYE